MAKKYLITDSDIGSYAGAKMKDGKLIIGGSLKIIRFRNGGRINRSHGKCR